METLRFEAKEVKFSSTEYYDNVMFLLDTCERNAIGTSERSRTFRSAYNLTARDRAWAARNEPRSLMLESNPHVLPRFYNKSCYVSRSRGGGGASARRRAWKRPAAVCSPRGLLPNSMINFVESNNRVSLSSVDREPNIVGSPSIVRIEIGKARKTFRYDRINTILMCANK